MNVDTKLLTKLQTLLEFKQCLCQCPFPGPGWIQDHIIAFSFGVSLVSSDLWQILIIPFSFINLMLLKRSGQLFHRKFLNFGLSSVFSQLNSCCGFGHEYHRSDGVSFSVHHFRGYKDTHMLWLVMLLLSTWLKWCLLAFPTIKLLLPDLHTDF